MARRLKYIDIFAGIGGFRQAFDPHAKCVFTSEKDKFALKTYTQNYDVDHAINTDIVFANDIPDHDILVAGFPCQPFSAYGISKRNSMGLPSGFLDETRGTMFFHILKILESHRPNILLLENVKNLHTHDKGNTFKVIHDSLAALGYNLSYRVINAKSYVPQSRERIFIVGCLVKTIDLNKMVLPESTPTLEDILLKDVPDKYYLSDKMWQCLIRHSERHKKSGNGFGYGLCTKNDVARTLMARYYKDGSEILIHDPSRPTPRRLTPRECARLMGFSDDFKIVVSDTQAYKQFGNSVVVPLVEDIANFIIGSI